MHKTSQTARTILVLLAGGAFLLSCGGSDAPQEENASSPSVLGPDAPAPAPPRSLAGLSEDELPSPDTVVARVNGAEIQARELFELTHMNRRRIQASGQALDAAAERELLRLSLDLLVDNELILQEAEKEGIRVEPDQLEEAFQELRDQAGTAEGFRQNLSNMGVTEEEFREELERNLLVQKYTERITGSAAATEEDAKAYFNENPGLFQEGEQVRVSQILIRSSTNDPAEKREADRARIDEIHARIEAGEPFADLAKEFSQIPNATKGGDVGFFPRGVMVPAFEEMAFNTPVGEVSPVFETPYGFNIIQVTDKKPSRPLPFEEVKPTLMLELSRRQGSEAVQSNVAGLRETAEIEVLTPELFEEPAPAEEPAEEAAG